MLIGYKLLNYYFGTICDCIRRRLFSFIYLIFEARIPVLWLRGSLRDLPGTWEEVLDANCCCASGPRPFSGTVPAAAGVAAATGEGRVCARKLVPRAATLQLFLPGYQGNRLARVLSQGLSSAELDGEPVAHWRKGVRRFCTCHGSSLAPPLGSTGS